MTPPLLPVVVVPYLGRGHRGACLCLALRRRLCHFHAQRPPLKLPRHRARRPRTRTRLGAGGGHERLWQLGGKGGAEAEPAR